MQQRDPQAIFAERPRIEASLREHVRMVLEDGTVGRRTKELCAAMCAALTFCEPLLVEHRRRARALGASTAKLNDLWEFARSDHYTAAERAALSSAVALSREPRALPASIWSELRAHFDEGQIAEVLCTVGAVNYLCRLRNAVDSERG